MRFETTSPLRTLNADHRYHQLNVSLARASTRNRDASYHFRYRMEPLPYSTEKSDDQTSTVDLGEPLSITERGAKSDSMLSVICLSVKD